MLSLRDNLILALTKLRTRRVRLVITLIVSGLLFSVLIVASLVGRGLVASLTSFTKEGFLNRFLVDVYNGNYYANMNIYDNATIMNRAMEISKQQTAKKVAEAKRLGAVYDPATDEQPYNEYKDNGKLHRVLNAQSAAGQQAIKELVDLEGPDKHLKEIAEKAHALGVYTNFSYGGGGGQNYQIVPVVDGKEKSYNSTTSYGPPDPIEAFSQSLMTNDNAMMKPFVFKGSSLTDTAGGVIPVLAPVNAAEKLLGLKAPLDTASPAEQLNHLDTLRTKAKDLAFTACYRNSAAVQKMDEAKKQADDIAAHQGEAGFQMPAVVYALPSEPCGTPTISRDTRTAQQRQADDNQRIFDEEFGEKPVTAKVPFRIVGLLPRTASLDSSLSFQSFISSFLSSSFTGGWIMSQQAALLNPILGPIQNKTVENALNSGIVSHYVEFASLNEQKSFIDTYNCQPSAHNSCNKMGDVMLAAYGNPLAGLYQAADAARSTFMTILFIVAAISAIIMMGTVGRVIADSRKETGVFRALGASRVVVDQIYFLYSLMLGVLAFVTASLIGLVTAALIDSYTVGPMSVAAVLAFNAQDLHKQFHLIGWSITDLAGIAALVLVTSLASALVPIMANARRDPVKDMREE